MKFSIRDLLLVTVIVALVLGWWVDHRAASSWRDRAVMSQERMRSALLSLDDLLKAIIDGKTNQGFLVPDVEAILREIDEPPNSSAPASTSPKP